jgi:transcriptional regulator of acetoin/glycerol metabolism
LVRLITREMRESWIGLQAGVDARTWARLLARAHGVAIRSGHVPPIVRGVIAESWTRCRQTGVDPDVPGAPLMIDPADAGTRWREHPLSRTTPILRSVLGTLLFEARHIVVVADADGCLLWADGHPSVLRASERIRFCPGHGWSERAAGTNAVGTALAADHAVQVFSAEHYRSEVHGWQCSGAPVHDPETGDKIGAIDVTGRYETAHPHTLALVELAARLAEQHLRGAMLERDARILAQFAEHTARFGGPAAALSPSGRVLAATPPAWTTGRIEVPADGSEIELGDGTAEIHPLGEGTLVLPTRPARSRPRTTPSHLELLGCERATLRTPTATHRLTARHGELAALLALHPDGLGARELSQLLYGAVGHEVAVRAELHRLREILGPALATRPYRLQGIEVDVTTVRRLLGGAGGAATAAVAAYAGPLLPRSAVPGIVAAREALERAVGAARGASDHA